MSDILKRAKLRRLVSPVLSFEFGGITFEVARFADSEALGSLLKTKEYMASQGIENNPELEGAKFVEEQWAIVSRHVKSFSAKEILDDVTLKDILECFTLKEQKEFIGAYERAKAKDDKEAEKKLQA